MLRELFLTFALIILFGCSSPTAPVLMGDVDGDGRLSLVDADMIGWFVIGAIEFTPEQIAVADVTGDGTISEHDSSWIRGRL